MDRDSPLPTQRLELGTVLAQARERQRGPITLDSPALDVMTDLTEVRAATTSPSTTLRQVEQVMIHQGVRLLFVISDTPALQGLITSTDLHGDMQMRLVQQRNVHYDELTVADVMTPLAELDAIDLEVMKHSSVSNVIATLRRHGRNHLLVVERGRADYATRVRGVISRTQVERQLGAPVPVTEVANSFAEVVRMLS